MTIRIEKVDLPGIGVRHDLVTENGRRLGVVSYRDGDRELTISDADDPDACAYALPINEDEAEA
ncbi:MAG: potassium transporter TrkA, partial [Microbacterium sp.]|nr:potassium transporter TrkA [Microbacterium sp.]